MMKERKFTSALSKRVYEIVPLTPELSIVEQITCQIELAQQLNQDLKRGACCLVIHVGNKFHYYDFPQVPTSPHWKTIDLK